MSATFRPEASGDERAVRAVVDDAFAGEPVVGQLVDALRRSPDWLPGLSFVAEVHGEIVGHVLFTRSLLDTPRRLVDVIVLSPASVASAHQGRGIGSALISHALEEVRRLRPEPLVFLEGAPGFYARFGFEPAEPIGFRRPSLRIPEPAFQVMRLPSWKRWMTGTLVYSRVFWELDCVGLRDGDRSPIGRASHPPRQIDHVTLNVADIAAARAFYAATLGELGLVESSDPHGRVEYGAEGRSDFGFYSRPNEVFQRAHVAFVAANRDQVDRFHAAALSHGGTSLDAPRERPEFGLYSAYLADAEGNGVEVGCALSAHGRSGPRPQRSGR